VTTDDASKTADSLAVWNSTLNTITDSAVTVDDVGSVTTTNVHVADTLQAQTVQASSIDAGQTSLNIGGDSDSNSISLVAPTSLTGSYAITLPATDGTDSQALSVTGANNYLQWSTPTDDTTATPAADAIITGGFGGQVASIVKGLSGQILTVVSGIPMWQAGPLTTPGSLLIGGTGGVPQSLAIGTYHQVLTSDGVSNTCRWMSATAETGPTGHAGPTGPQAQYQYTVTRPTGQNALTGPAGPTGGLGRTGKTGDIGQPGSNGWSGVIGCPTEYGSGAFAQDHFFNVYWYTATNCLTDNAWAVNQTNTGGTVTFKYITTPAELGVIIVDSGSTIGNSVCLYKMSKIMLPSWTHYLSLRFSITARGTNASDLFAFGVSNNQAGTLTAGTTEAVLLVARGGTPNFRLIVSNSSGGSDDVDTGVAVATNTYFVCTLAYSATISSVTFSTGQNVQSTIIGGNNGKFCFYVKSGSTTGCTVNIDYWCFQAPYVVR
jgi:hypothetical protein